MYDGTYFDILITFSKKKHLFLKSYMYIDGYGEEFILYLTLVQVAAAALSEYKSYEP